MKKVMAIQNAKGMTLIEIFVALGLTSIVFTSLISTFQFYNSNTRFARAEAEVDRITEQISLNLARDPSCSGNLNGIQIPKGKNEIDLGARGFYKFRDLIRRDYLLSTASKEARYVGSKIVVKNEIKKTIYTIAELILNFEVNNGYTTTGCSSTKNSTVAMNRSIGLLLELDSKGTVLSCHTADDIQAEKICALNSDSTMTYDPISESCKSNKTSRIFAHNDRFTASCGSGWTLTTCSISAPEYNYSVWSACGPIVTTQVLNSDGTTTSTSEVAPALRAVPDFINNSCTCSYNSALSCIPGYDTTWGPNTVCQAVCEQ